MNKVSTLSIISLILFSSSVCSGDSLVITYRSGKTQTVVLDEPSLGINSWQFVGDLKPLQQIKEKNDAATTSKHEQVQENLAVQAQDDKKLTDKPLEKKSGVRIKWNAKPIAD
jgi:hypothetical protein